MHHSKREIELNRSVLSRDSKDCFQHISGYDQGEKLHPTNIPSVRAIEGFSVEFLWLYTAACLNACAQFGRVSVHCGHHHKPMRYQKNCIQVRLRDLANAKILH